jgi:hypothetical protein
MDGEAILAYSKPQAKAAFQEMLQLVTHRFLQH